MEAPSDKNLPAFYRLISTYKLSHLVRLTPNFELGRESCFSYWKKGMNIDPLTKGATIEISGKKIHYFPIENWKNHEGYGSEKLLSLVKEVMKGPDPKMIGVHCRAGVGRSGTFIAAYTLIHDIDKQIANSVDINHLKINIDQVVWELSLQRPFMVCHFAQYLTLYKLINYYMTILKFNSIQETISLEFN
jgi:protein tyrosine phosphatase